MEVVPHFHVALEVTSKMLGYDLSSYISKSYSGWYTKYKQMYNPRLQKVFYLRGYRFDR